MKKIFFIAVIITLALAATLHAFAADIEVTNELATAEETVATTDVPAAETAATTDVPAGTEITPDADEDRIALTELLFRVWEENKELIFSAISAAVSFFVLWLTKQKYIPQIYTAVKKVGSRIDLQDTGLADFKNETSSLITAMQEKLDSFANYDELTREVKAVMDEHRLDRQVLIKTIELQAGQINRLIENSNLPQARKDALYDEYRAQLCEIEKLKGEGASDQQ
jgi:hypothetical protein